MPSGKSKTPELVQALRQCDGGRVQCVVMVRDDFWLAVSRFFKRVGGRTRPRPEPCPGRSVRPATTPGKCWRLLGGPSANFPRSPAKPARSRREFLNQAVSGLAQEGKVICVRLALFAEMMKGKPWTPATLEGSGRHRRGRRHVPRRNVLCPHRQPEASAAPESGQGRPARPCCPKPARTSRATCGRTPELLEASGYASRPKDFDDLLRILDSELRLITPTDPEGKEGPRVQPAGPTHRPEILPTDPRLSGSLAAGLADPQAEGDEPGPGRTAAGGSGGGVERPPGEPPTAVAAGNGCRFGWLTQKKNWTPPPAEDDAEGDPLPCRAGAAAGRACWSALSATGLMVRSQIVEQSKATSCRRARAALLDADTPQVPAIVGRHGGLSALDRPAAARGAGRRRNARLPPATPRQPGPAARGRLPGGVPVRSAARCRAGRSSGDSRRPRTAQGRIAGPVVGRRGSAGKGQGIATAASGSGVGDV